MKEELKPGHIQKMPLTCARDGTHTGTRGLGLTGLMKHSNPEHGCSADGGVGGSAQNTDSFLPRPGQASCEQIARKGWKTWALSPVAALPESLYSPATSASRSSGHKE